MRTITIISILLIGAICYLFTHQLHFKNNYSPLDSYINATIQRSADSAKHAIEVTIFLDSINHK